MKKSNLYSSVDYNSLQKEVKSILQYLEQLDIENISDDLEWKITAKGGVAPAIISTIEKKILTSLKVIQQCSRIALAMNDKEGLTPFLEGMIFTVVNTLKNIQGYYNNRPIALIEHRKLTKESGKEYEFDAVKVGKELAAVRIVGWRGIKEDYTPDNAKKLCASNQMIADQVMSKSNALENFIKL